MPGSRPPYSLLRQNYPAPKDVPPQQLWQSIGYPENAEDSDWKNTCAIRLSLALVAAGMVIRPGFLQIKAGKFTNRKLEIKVVALSDFLMREWGEPEKYSGALAWEKIFSRKGVIRFVQLWGPFDPQGHIDLIGPSERNRVAECAGACFFHSVEVWFWECP
jgi:hypothetical protein